MIATRVYLEVSTVFQNCMKWNKFFHKLFHRLLSYFGLSWISAWCNNHDFRRPNWAPAIYCLQRVSVVFYFSNRQRDRVKSYFRNSKNQFSISRKRVKDRGRFSKSYVSIVFLWFDNDFFMILIQKTFYY